MSGQTGVSLRSGKTKRKDKEQTVQERAAKAQSSEVPELGPQALSDQLQLRLSEAEMADLTPAPGLAQARPEGLLYILLSDHPN